jgi:hypothetical protein
MPMKKNSAAAIKQLHRVEKKRQAIITKLLHIHNEKNCRIKSIVKQKEAEINQVSLKAKKKAYPLSLMVDSGPVNKKMQRQVRNLERIYRDKDNRIEKIEKKSQQGVIQARLKAKKKASRYAKTLKYLREKNKQLYTEEKF